MGGCGWCITVNSSSSQCAETASTARGVMPIAAGKPCSHAARPSYICGGSMDMNGHGPPPCEMKTVGSGAGAIMTLLAASGSGLELRAVAELLQHLGIGKRFDVPHRSSVHDVAHGQLDDLAALRARYVGDLADLGRYVSW